MESSTYLRDCTGESANVLHGEGLPCEDRTGIVKEREMIMAEALGQFRMAIKKVSDEMRIEVAKRRPFHQAFEVNTCAFLMFWYLEGLSF